jgi:mRNA deadenylase 3'-5' endonuclease subunit Ccr4
MIQCSESTEPIILDGCITVMSFNILAQCYTHQFLAEGTPKGVLDWETRAPKIINEITRYSPDIVCLQECDRWDNFMAPEMERHGYSGTFKIRTGGREDGVAILWKQDTFELHSSESIEYGMFGGVGLVVCLSRKIPHAASHEPLESSRTEMKISIANTHLYWNSKEMEYILLRQAQMFLLHAAQVSWL